MTITYLGTASFIIETPDIKVIIDPGDFLTQRLTKKLAKNITGIDLALITHSDFDHCNRLKYIPGTDSIQIIGSESVRKKFPRYTISTKQYHKTGDLTIEKINIPHGMRHCIDHTGYKVSAGSKNIIHCGDGITITGPVHNNIDILCVTIGGIEAGIKNAVKLAARISPSMVAPMHWERCIRSSRRAAKFASLMASECPSVKTVIPGYFTPMSIE